MIKMGLMLYNPYFQEVASPVVQRLLYVLQSMNWKNNLGRFGQVQWVG